MILVGALGFSISSRGARGINIMRRRGQGCIDLACFHTYTIYGGRDLQEGVHVTFGKEI